MGYSGDSALLGGASLFAPQWQDHIMQTNANDAAAIVAAYQQFAPVANVNADLALAQAALETGNFHSSAWRDRRNAAGINITGADVEGPDFGSIENGVKGHLELLRNYFIAGGSLWGVLAGFGLGGGFRELSRLNEMNGVWAVPGDGYGEGIAEIANEVTGGVAPTPVPAPTPPVPNTSVITGEQVAAMAESYIGRTTFSDGSAGVQSLERCEEFVEVIHEVLGVPRHLWYNAVRHGQALAEEGLLITDPAMFERGMIGFWNSVFFDPDGHTSVYRGDGTFVGAGGPAITISPTTWLTHPGFMGMCFYPGVGSAQQGDQEGIPVGDGFAQSEVLRLWFGNKTEDEKQRPEFTFHQGFGIENTYVAAANGQWEGAPGRSVVLGEVMSDEESDPDTPGRSIRYFQNGKITALKQDDNSYVFKIN